MPLCLHGLIASRKKSAPDFPVRLSIIITILFAHQAKAS